MDQLQCFCCKLFTATILYIYVKGFRTSPSFLMEGYSVMFKILAEFVGAVFCFSYGLMEMDLVYFTLGTMGILTGLFGKTRLFCNKNIPHDSFHLRCLTCIANVLTIAFVFICSFGFHGIVTKAGFLDCSSTFATCVVPMISLSKSFKARNAPVYSFICDCIAVWIFWWHCAHLPVKYFLVAPVVVSLLFSVIEFVMDEKPEDTPTPL